MVRSEVNAIDFLAITGIQVFIPEVYYGIRDNKDRFGKNYYAWFALHCDNLNCKAGEKQKYNNEKSGYYTEPMSKYLNLDILNESNMDKWDLKESEGK